MGLVNVTYPSLQRIFAELKELGLVESTPPTPGNGRLRENIILTNRGIEVLRLWRTLRPFLGLKETYALEVLSRW